MPTYPGMEILNLGAMGMEPPTEFQERHKVKTKKKEKKETVSRVGTKLFAFAQKQIAIANKFAFSPFQSVAAETVSCSSETISESYGIPLGVYVAAVSDTGAAYKAGIKQGDIITRVCL